MADPNFQCMFANGWNHSDCAEPSRHARDCQHPNSRSGSGNDLNAYPHPHMLYREQDFHDNVAPAAVGGRETRNLDYDSEKPVPLGPATLHRHSVVVGHCFRGLEVVDVHKSEGSPGFDDSNDCADVCSSSSSSKF